MDADGYVSITGRLKEIINRGGEKISPREVDEIIMEHPAVHQCVTFGMPHEMLGEEVAAAIVLKEGVACDDRELRQFAAVRLADFKVPKKILILKEIPVGATGKLQRIGLAQKLGLGMSLTARAASREVSGGCLTWKRQCGVRRRDEGRAGIVRHPDLPLVLPVHQQPEHVRPAVVAADVQLPTRAGDLIEVDLAVNDLLRAVARTRHELAIRVHDGAVAGIHPPVIVGLEQRLERQPVGHVGDPDGVPARDDVHSALLRDVPERR